jgi:hypothetical protein
MAASARRTSPGAPVPGATPAAIHARAIWYDRQPSHRRWSVTTATAQRWVLAGVGGAVAARSAAS